MKKNYLLNVLLPITFLVVFALNFSANAHNPLSASFDLKIFEDGGVLEATLTQAGVDKALKQKYGAEAVSLLPEEQYKELLLHYIKENVSIKAGEEYLVLGAGGIRLGTHQTDLKLIIEEVPKNYQQIEIVNTCFQENKHHQTLFYLHRMGNRGQLFLNSFNDFSGTFLVEQGEISIVQTSDYTAAIYFLLAGFSLTLAGILFYKKNQTHIQKRQRDSLFYPKL